jgi:hypothetical protein
MVILLHREDAYERESPRAGEADFIVAKHRNGPTDTITVAFQRPLLAVRRHGAVLIGDLQISRERMAVAPCR